MNSVFLIGRLTKDPELKYGSDSQKAYCRFTLAVDKGKNKDGTDAGANFPSVVAFGKTAENMERFTKKGRLIAVEGRLETGKYQNKKGDTVYTTDVYANRVEFLEWGDVVSDKQEKPAEESQMGFAMIDDDIPF